MVFFTKEEMRYPPRQDSNMDAPSSARKSHAQKCTKKLAAFRTLSNCHGPYGTIERRGSPQSRCGVDSSPFLASIIRMRTIMAAAIFSPAVEGHRAKYDEDFRVLTLYEVRQRRREATANDSHLP
jgi:hypothetical protein